MKPQTSRSILVSARNTFSNAYYTFFNPADATAGQQTLTLPMSNPMFPFSNLGSGVKIESINFYVFLSVPAAGNTISAAFSRAGGTSQQIALSPVAGATTAGDAIMALTAPATLAPSVAAPETFILTVPAASVPAALAVTVNGQTRLDSSKIEDILLVITYSIS